MAKKKKEKTIKERKKEVREKFEQTIQKINQLQTLAERLRGQYALLEEMEGEE